MSKPRQSVLTEEKKRIVLAIVGAGCSRRTAARYVGCSPSTIAREATRDPAFGEQLLSAQCNTELASLRNIQKAARKEQYWRAAAWLLERLNPADFAPRKPDALNVEHLRVIIAEMARIFGEEVPEEYRQPVLKRLSAIVPWITEDLIEKSHATEA